MTLVTGVQESLDTGHQVVAITVPSPCDLATAAEDGSEATFSITFMQCGAETHSGSRSSSYATPDNLH
jgi:hypothetical protein